MAKKDFTNISTQRVYAEIQEATAEQEILEIQETPAEFNKPEEQETQEAQEKQRKSRKTYTEEQAQAARMTGKTAGLKGVKLQRINMGFTPDVYDYIRTMARVSGLTMTDFVNKALREHLEQHQGVYDKAIEFKNSL